MSSGAMAPALGARAPGLLLAVFVSSIPATLILPMMPSLGERYGLSGPALGLLFAIYPLMSVVSAPLWGRISDRAGRRPALLGSLALSALAFLVFGLAESWLGLLLGRAAQGLAGSARVIGFAVVSDVTSGEERPVGMGRITAAMAAAYTIGPLVGAAFLAEQPGTLLAGLRVALGAPAAGFDQLLPCLVGAALNGLALLIIALRFRETWRPAARAGTGAGSASSDGDRRALFSLAVIVLIGLFLVSGFVQGTVQFSFTLWAAAAIQWTAREIAIGMFVLGLGFIVASGGLMRPLVRSVGSERCTLVGAVIDLAGLALFLAAGANWPLALAGLFLSSLGGGLWGTTIISLLSRQAPGEAQGMMIGVANSASLVGRVAGPPVAGLLTELQGPRAPFALLLGCVLLIAAWAARLRPSRS